MLQFRGNWEVQLALTEFAYNNRYHSSIGMAPYEAPYGKQCRTPLCWSEVGKWRLIGPELVQLTAEKIDVIREMLKTAQSRPMSYANRRRKDLEFQIGDCVFLKLSPWKGMVRFGKQGKLSPRFNGLTRSWKEWVLELSTGLAF